MDQQRILARLEPMFPVLVDVVRNGHEDFERLIPAADRLTVECTRPLFIWARILHRLEMAYGVEGPERVIERDGLKYLFIEADGFDIGLRNKKLSKRLRTANHPSGQQDALRRQLRFPYNETTAHVFLRWRQSGELARRLTHILLTCESTDRIVWRHLLWSIDDGTQPITPIYPLFPPSPPGEEPLKAKPRKKRRGKDVDGESGQGSG